MLPLVRHFLIELQTLEVIIKIQGNVQLQGKTEVLKVSVLGSGNFQGKELHTHKGNLSISVTGNIEATVSEEVQAKLWDMAISLSLEIHPREIQTSKEMEKYNFL